MTTFGPATPTYNIQTMATNRVALPLDVRTELVEKLITSGADPNVLIVKAKDKGMIGSIQASAAVAPGSESAREKAEHLVNQVFEVVGADDTKAEDFAQLLEENNLGQVANFLREKLTERPPVPDSPPFPLSMESYTPPQEPQQRLPGDGFERSQPKLEPVSDSGVVSQTNGTSQTGQQNGNMSPEFDKTQHSRKASGGITAVPGALVYAEQEHTGNLEAAPDNPVHSVADTQPHLEGSESMLGERSAQVLPETKNLLQKNQDLQAQLAEKNDNEERLQEKLEKMSIEKKESEEKLKQKDREIQEKESQMKQLKQEKEFEIKQLKKKVEHLEVELQTEKESNMIEKTDLQEKIRYLETQLQENEAKHNQEKFNLIEEKHDLQLQIQKMRTEEERLKRRILEEKCKVADLCTQAEKDKTERAIQDLKREHDQQMEKYEQQMESMKQEHRNSLSQKDQQHQVAIEVLNLKLEKQTSAIEPNTSQGDETEKPPVLRHSHSES